MIFTCPCCFARFSIEATLGDEAARKAIATALKLPAPLGELVLRYIALFRAPQRALSWERAARLLGELLEPIQAARVERHGRSWAAPVEAWRGALEEMLERRDKLQLPLTSHGYLFEILAARANSAEGRAEKQAERNQRDRAQGVAPPAANGPKKISGTALEENLARLKGAVKP